MINKCNLPLLSIILPVYNAKNYVAKAIESIVEQDDINIELIMIDDGSSDGSAVICDAYAEKYPCIKLIHKKNQGLCAARNQGLELATGKYIAFCDHDDICLPGGFRNLLEAAEGNGAQIAKGTYLGEQVKGTKILRSYSSSLPNGIFSLEEIVDQYSFFNIIIRALWNGIYLTNIIRKYQIRFDTGLKAGTEDYDFNLKFLKHAEQVVTISTPVFKHFARFTQSASLGYNENRQQGIVQAFQKEAEFLSKYEIKIDTFMLHQRWYLNMLKVELNYDDCLLSDVEKIDKILNLMNHTIDFKNPVLLDLIKVFLYKPQLAVLWILYHHRKAGLIIKIWKIQKIKQKII